MLGISLVQRLPPSQAQRSVGTRVSESSIAPLPLLKVQGRAQLALASCPRYYQSVSHAEIQGLERVPPQARCLSPVHGAVSLWKKARRVRFTTYPAALATEACWGTKGNGEVCAEAAWNLQTGIEGLDFEAWACTRQSLPGHEGCELWVRYRRRKEKTDRAQEVGPGTLIYKDQIKGAWDLGSK